MKKDKDEYLMISNRLLGKIGLVLFICGITLLSASSYITANENKAIIGTLKYNNDLAGRAIMELQSNQQAISNNLATMMQNSGLSADDFYNYAEQDELLEALRNGENIICGAGQRFQGDPLYYGPCIVPGKDRTTENVVQVFTDFSCPFCKRAYEELKGLWEEKGFEELPIKTIQTHGLLSVNESIAYVCAYNQHGGDEMADKLFVNQEDVYALANQDKSVQPLLRGFAEEIGLDMEKYDQCLITSVLDEVLQEDSEDALSYGIQATPSFIINGNVKIIGAQPVNVFEQTLEILSN